MKKKEEKERRIEVKISGFLIIMSKSAFEYSKIECNLYIGSSSKIFSF